MSQFPTIRPSGRSLRPAAVPMTVMTALSGKETRVITGDRAFSAALRMEFRNLTEAVANQITDHWSGQLGMALAFTLPVDAWAGWDTFDETVDPAQQWRYASVPQVRAVSPGIMSVSVELVSV
jgi:hypothetical protein